MEKPGFSHRKLLEAHMIQLHQALQETKDVEDIIKLSMRLVDAIATYDRLEN